MRRHSLTVKIYLYALVAFAVLSLGAKWAAEQLISQSQTLAVNQTFSDRARFIGAEVGRLEMGTPAALARVAALERGLSAQLQWVPWHQTAAYPATLRMQDVAIEPGLSQRPSAQRYWVRVEQQGQPVGALGIRFTSPYGRNVRFPASSLPVTVIILALVLFPPIHFWVIRPLRRLEGAVKRLGDGDLQTPVGEAGRDELGRLAEGFDQMRRQVSDMLHQKERLLTDVSHELRGPMTRMALAQTLLEEAVGEQPYVGRLRQELQRMDALVGELLDLARFRRPPHREPEALDLTAIVAELLAERELVLQQGQYQVTRTATPIWAMGDPVLVRRAIGNVLDNAINYTPPGGKLDVETFVTPDRAVCRLTDSGQGISQQALPHIFEPFYRPDTARTRDRGGTGLGLAIVKTVIEHMAGQVTISSDEGVGTTLELRLPVPPASHPL